MSAISAIGPNPALVERVNGADLLIVLGARLGEMTTSAYTLLGRRGRKQRMVQVLNGPEELGRVYQPDLVINCSLPAMAATLARLQPWASAHGPRARGRGTRAISGISHP
jgi:acetolactate synthase-1/2/3 large subunit